MSSMPQTPKWTRAILAVWILLLYIPFVWMLLTAFGGPDDWGLQLFQAVLSNDQWIQALVRSFWVALFASVFATLLGLGAAVASTSKLKPWLEVFSVMALVLPELVFALSLLSWFVTLKFELGLWTVGIAHITFSLSFSYYLIVSRFRQIDSSLLEAAADLGAQSWQTFTRVILPLLLPSMGVSILICFLLSFDDFLISFFVNGVGQDTLPMKLYGSVKTGVSAQLTALATLMSFLSTAALVLVMNSSFAQQFFQGRKKS